jgi:hypothetical protein
VFYWRRSSVFYRPTVGTPRGDARYATGRRSALH